MRGLSIAGTAVSVAHTRNQLAREYPVEIEGFDPDDYEEGHSWENVYLGEAEGGLSVYGTIEVDKTLILRRKRFVITDVHYGGA